MANCTNTVNKLLTGHLISCSHVHWKSQKGTVSQASLTGRDHVFSVLISLYSFLDDSRKKFDRSICVTQSLVCQNLSCDTTDPIDLLCRPVAEGSMTCRVKCGA